MASLWVVTGRTESGDEFEYVFDFKPTDDQVDAVICDDMPDEYSEIGFTNWSLNEDFAISKEAVTEEMVASMKKKVEECY